MSLLYVPAILKGFFDRVLVPGVAFDHPSGGDPLILRLTHASNGLFGASDQAAAAFPLLRPALSRHQKKNA